MDNAGSIPVAMVVEVAGSASVNTFGIYNIADPSRKIQVFAGADTGGATTAFVSPYATFGFYLINPALGFTWYSDSSLNGGENHMVAYQGKGQTLNLGNHPNNPAGSVLWDANSYLLAWEDEDFADSDLDYNDMDVIVSFQPVPDSYATIGLLGMAMMGLVFLQNYPKASAVRRKRK